MPDILTRICAQVLNGDDVLDETTRSLAREHGASRFSVGLRGEFIVLESRLLQREVAYVVQQNLLVIDLSTLVPDAMKVADFIVAAAEESIRSLNERLLAV